MIFFDTCVWIELFGVKTPRKDREKRRAMATSAVFQAILQSDEQIVTCKEQLLEIISAIQKVKMKQYNREQKAKGLTGVGDLKAFRATNSFADTKELCEMVISDVLFFAQNEADTQYNIENILARINIADINDCIYYDYCKSNNIKLYTLDHDLLYIDSDNVVEYISYGNESDT